MVLEITGDRVSITRTAAMAQALLDSYSEAEQTTFGKEQDVWIAAARERITHAQHGGMPVDIYRSLRQEPLSRNGLTLMIHAPDATYLPTETGGVRMSTGQDGDIEHMEFDEISAEEWAGVLAEHLPVGTLDELKELL